EISISNITDIAGNIAASNSISFTTQDSATQPATINSIKVYSDTSYTNELASGSIVPPASTVAISVETNDDASPTTTDFVNISIKNCSNNQIKNLSLAETGNNTGIFRGTAEMSSDENSYILFYTEVDTHYTALQTDIYPKFLTFNPASNSTELYLDNNFEITANKEIDDSTVNKASIILEGKNGSVNYEVSLSDTNKILISNTEAEEGDKLTLTLTNSIKDKTGLNFPLVVAEYEVKTQQINSFKLYKNMDYTDELSNNSNIEANQEIYCEIKGVDLTQEGLTDSIEINFNSEEILNTLIINEISEGKFRGSFLTPDLPGKSLKVFPTNFENKAINLNILEAFALTDYYPASASIGIPADSWPTWTFNREIQNSQLTNKKFSLYEVSSNTKIDGSLSLSPSKKQVRFMPSSVLDLLTTYEMRLSKEVTDATGNKLGTSLTTRFTTQPPPAPPTEIISFANYSDENYLSTSTAILSNSNLYLQMVANDPSFSTYEVSSVRLDSDDGTYDGEVLTLIETNPPSGIYSLKYPVSLPSGTKITLTPQADDSFAIVLTVKEKPKLTSLKPASGTTDLYLDTSFEMSFSAPIATESFNNSVVIKNKNNESISYSCIFENNDNKVTLTPETILNQNESFSISANNIISKEGQTIDPFTYKITTKKETTAYLELYTGLAPCDGKKVSETNEVVKGILGIVASTTDMLKYSEESRILRLSDASH
ncbi:MAG: Ig-like domain-containing protein, partial [Candidatus Riflebacteria bacterium]|nr:Ig-like domain-containing protein [Candidatus Riflebacteria bacterium]